MYQRHAQSLKGARIVLEKCLHLKSHDTFLLIYDETTLRFPGLFAEACHALDVSFQRAFVGSKAQALGRAFTPDLLLLLGRAHGILVATTDDETCSRFRIELTTDKRGAKSTVATMPGASLELLADAIDLDYEDVARMCLELTLPLVKGKHCKVSTFDRQGREYALDFTLGGVKRPPIQSYGIIPRQAWGNVPAGETFVAPNETSANGKLLVNGAIGTEKVQRRREALLEFKDGRLIRHRYLENGRPVKVLLHIAQVAKQNNQSACWPIIAEFGIGVNKNIKRITGVQLVDEKKYGTIHIAVGHNTGYGGTNSCQSVHCDMTTNRPTVTVDGHTIIDRGEHVYDLTLFEDSFRTYRPPQGALWPAGWTHVAINEDTYRLGADHIFLVRKITNSGRETVYPIGDEETSLYATRLVRAAADDTVALSALETKLSLDGAALRKLLAIFLENDIAVPVK